MVLDCFASLFVVVCDLFTDLVWAVFYLFDFIVFVKDSCSYGDCVFVVPYVRIWCLILGVCCLAMLVGLGLLFWFA